MGAALLGAGRGRLTQREAADERKYIEHFQMLDETDLKAEHAPPSRIRRNEVIC
jgi:hypothetical protein